MKLAFPSTLLPVCLGLCLLLSTNSCIDVIDLNTVEVGEVLVIEGAVYAGGSLPSVTIRRSGAFVAGPDGVQQPVSGAKVSITEVGGQTLELEEVDAGIYQGSTPIGTTGKEYTLQVEVDGNTYVSLTETMPERVALDEVSWEVRELTAESESGNIVTNYQFVLLADATLPDLEEGPYLRYRTESIYEYRERSSASNISASYCYIRDEVDLNNLAIIDGKNINQGQLINQPILSKLVDSKFTWGVCFTAIQQSISANAFNYWTSIQNEFERTGDIFESPPAKIKGNIFNTVSTKNDVIGLFSAIASDSVKIHAIGLEVREIAGRTCQCQCWPPPQNESCSNCLSLSKSSLNKPECF
ncbi:MAG: DUF4249 domain-containing protein [Bacteroidota bacterium]